MKKLLLLLLLAILFTACKTVEKGGQMSILPKYILSIEQKQFGDKWVIRDYYVQYIGPVPHFEKCTRFESELIKALGGKIQFDIGATGSCIESAWITSTGNVYFEGDNY